LVATVVAGFALFPPPPPEKLAVAQVRSGNLSGAGFLVGNQLVLTAARVVGNQTQVTLQFPDKPEMPAQVLFADPASDIALLLAKDLDAAIKPLPLGNSETTVERDEIYLVGYPGEVYAVTPGTLVRKTPELFETDAASNPGNSGGPLIRKSDDTVVGLLVATPELGGPDDKGHHRAVPINFIDKLCKERQKPIR
jgi:S1-C subfamily serine protease